jgi:hypothetical protein
MGGLRLRREWVVIADFVGNRVVVDSSRKVGDAQRDVAFVDGNV